MSLEAINLTKYYSSRLALEGVTFSIAKGESVGILGLGGSGKSTVLRLLTGFVAPTFGTIAVCGMDPMIPAARETFGYLPEGNPLPDHMRVGEYLYFRAGLKGLGRKSAAAAEEAAERCQVRQEAATMIFRLSRINRQRVGFADAVLGNPPILLIDDPTAGLEFRMAEEVRELLADLGRGTTLLLSSSTLDDVERLCPRAIILDRGRMATDGNLRDICDAYIEERTLCLELQTSEPVRETFRVVPGVRAVSVEASPGNPRTMRVRITMPSGVDLRREISSICASRGWLATEMRMEPMQLEDIFRRMT